MQLGEKLNGERKAQLERVESPSGATFANTLFLTHTW